MIKMTRTCNGREHLVFAPAKHKGKEQLDPERVRQGRVRRALEQKLEQKEIDHFFDLELDDEEA